MAIVRRHLDAVLVKPAGPDCNMACAYCFYLGKTGLFPAGTHRMTDDVLDELVRQVMSQPVPDLSFAWQGGEPTLMGLPFFRKAVDHQIRYGRGKTVGNGLQTNGLLLDGDWAAFLAERAFLVGLSLDGPGHVHDRYRTLRGGRSTWSAVADKALMLLDAGVAVNAVSVVTDYSSSRAEEIYRFHKDLGLTHMQFIPCLEADPRDPARPAPFSVSPGGYGRFLVELFDLWLGDVRDGVAATSVRYFDSVFHRYVELEAPDCTLGERCGVNLVVEHNGDVFSCDFFVEPAWKLGNVREGRLIDMLNSPRQVAFGAMKAARHARCAECPWLRLCFGGCTKDRLRVPADDGQTHFCLSYRMFFEHADRALRDLADQWLRRRQRLAAGAPAEEGWARVGPGRNDPCPCGSGKKYKVCCLPAGRRG